MKAQKPYIIDSAASLQSMIGDIRALWDEVHWLKVSVSTSKPRSLDQNDLSHAWYAQIARELREDDALGWKAYCKLHHGVPILRAEDEEFRVFYDGSLKKLSYEQKLQAMKYLPVSSLMTKPQLSKYLEAMQADFADRVKLEFPPD